MDKQAKRERIQKRAKTISAALMARKIMEKWTSESNVNAEKYELYLEKKQKEFKKYKFNIYILNHNALIIQNWFFRRVSDRLEVEMAKSEISDVSEDSHISAKPYQTEEAHKKVTLDLESKSNCDQTSNADSTGGAKRVRRSKNDRKNKKSISSAKDLEQSASQASVVKQPETKTDCQKEKKTVAFNDEQPLVDKDDEMDFEALGIEMISKEGQSKPKPNTIPAPIVEISMLMNIGQKTRACTKKYQDITFPEKSDKLFGIGSKADSRRTEAPVRRGLAPPKKSAVTITTTTSSRRLGGGVTSTPSSQRATGRKTLGPRR